MIVDLTPEQIKLVMSAMEGVRDAVIAKHHTDEGYSAPFSPEVQSVLGDTAAVEHVLSRALTL